jgi:H+/gluconate symporter-like permease
MTNREISDHCRETAAAIIAPLGARNPGLHSELLVIATGAGSLIFSHLK